MALVDTDRAPAPTPLRSTSTTNACRMCMPLGASLAACGIEGAVPFLHGSQGCATYIRRYLISHHREPVDIASSSLGEAATVFGGEENLREGLANVHAVYEPGLVVVATTCLTETIGEDVAGILARARADRSDLPPLVHVPTPSYSGTHADGYQAAVAAAVTQLAEPGEPTGRVVVLPGVVSPADVRHLREVLEGFGLTHTLLPDIADRLDGVATGRDERIPAGGTPVDQVAAACRARATITLGGLVSPGVDLAGDLLSDRYAVPGLQLPLPVGIRMTDLFVGVLEALSERDLPARFASERGRLVDSYVDGHKYVAQTRAVLFGDEDLVLAIAVWLAEIGVTPVLCATGGRSGRLAGELSALAPELDGRVTVVDDGDLGQVEDLAQDACPDLVIGSSKGYPIARRLGVPLVRVGMPVHDRVGAQRIRHLGYGGTQALFDRVVNALIARRQDSSSVGYAYM